MSITQQRGPSCVNKVPELKYLTLDNIQEWAGWCEEGYSRAGLQRKWKRMISIPSVVLARWEIHYLSLFFTGPAALEKIVSEKVATENRRHALAGMDRKQEADLKLTTNWWLQRPLK